MSRCFPRQETSVHLCQILMPSLLDIDLSCFALKRTCKDTVHLAAVGVSMNIHACLERCACTGMALVVSL